MAAEVGQSQLFSTQTTTTPTSTTCCYTNDPYVKTAEIIAIAVIGTFAVLAKPEVFLGALTLGALYQFAKIQLNLSRPENGSSRPGCGQGYGEFFSGVKFWPLEVVGVIAALAWQHLQMDPHFFIPFFGFFMGMRAIHLSLESFKSPPMQHPCCK